MITSRCRREYRSTRKEKTIPEVTGAYLEASGGATSNGLYISASSPTVTGVRAKAAGTNNSYGMYIYGSNEARVANSFFEAKNGSTANRGVYIYGTSVSTALADLNNITGVADSSGNTNFGVTVRGATSRIHASRFVASGASVTSNNGCYLDLSDGFISNSSCEATEGAASNRGLYILGGTNKFKNSQLGRNHQCQWQL